MISMGSPGMDAGASAGTATTSSLLIKVF